MNENEQKLLQIFQEILENQKKQNLVTENIRDTLAIFLIFSVIIPAIFWVVIYILYKSSPETLINILKSVL